MGYQQFAGAIEHPELRRLDELAADLVARAVDLELPEGETLRIACSDFVDRVMLMDRDPAVEAEVAGHSPARTSA